MEELPECSNTDYVIWSMQSKSVDDSVADWSMKTRCSSLELISEIRWKGLLGQTKLMGRGDAISLL